MISTEVVAVGLDMPEGPCIDASGVLHVVEIGAGFVTSIDTATGDRERRHQTGGGPNGCALGPDGNLYVANNGGVEKAEEFVDVTGRLGIGRIERCVPLRAAVETVVSSGADRAPLDGPNDLAFDRAGALWFTDPGHGDLKTPRGVVYRTRPDGSEIAAVAAGYQYCNGLAFTSDGEVLIVAETGSRSLWAHDVIGTELGERRLFARLPRGCGPDGLCIDAHGNVLVAGAFGGSVFVFDPDGNDVERIDVEDKLVTNLAFGGPELRHLYITLTNLGQVVMADWPVPGLPLPA